LSEIVGHADLRHRPLINLSIPGREDPVLALIDTGFNGYLLTNHNVAQQLDFRLPGIEISVELAGHTVRRFELADGRIDWFGEIRQVPVLVSSDEPAMSTVADEPWILIGTALLNPHRLIIDFSTRRVLIAQAD
jgi:predicted aspartyl protease